MKDKIGLIITVIAIVGLFAGIYFLYSALSEKYTPERITVNDNSNNSDKNSWASSENTELKEYSVDNFTVYDADGNRVELWDFIGKPIVLNFWASWCGPCQSEIPHFEQAYAENSGVMFMMVNLDDTKSSGKDYIEKNGFTFPVYYDTTGEAAQKYGIMYIPTTFLIDRNGELVGKVDGSMSKDELNRCISLVNGEEELIIQ